MTYACCRELSIFVEKPNFIKQNIYGGAAAELAGALAKQTHRGFRLDLMGEHLPSVLWLRSAEKLKDEKFAKEAEKNKRKDKRSEIKSQKRVKKAS